MEHLDSKHETDGYGGMQHSEADRLSGEYGTVRELIAKQTPDWVSLILFEEGKKARRFDLRDTELDALIEARAKFKHQCQCEEDAYNARIAQEIEEAKQLISMVNEDRGFTFVLVEDGKYYALKHASNDNTVLYSMYPHKVLDSVRTYFVNQKYIPEPLPGGVPSSDDFDPFLDSDDEALP